MWHNNVCYTTFPAKFHIRKSFQAISVYFVWWFYEYILNDRQKMVKNKLSKLKMYSNVESLWTGVIKRMTMAMTDAMVRIYTFIFQFICQYIFLFICQFHESVVTARYRHFVISWSGSVSSYQFVIHFRDMAYNQHVKINLFIWTTLKNKVPSCVITVCDNLIPLMQAISMFFIHKFHQSCGQWLFRWTNTWFCCHGFNKHLWPILLTWFNFNPSMDK